VLIRDVEPFQGRLEVRRNVVVSREVDVVGRLVAFANVTVAPGAIQILPAIRLGDARAPALGLIVQSGVGGVFRQIDQRQVDGCAVDDGGRAAIRVSAIGNALRRRC